jgi:hypothetical protein
VRRLPMDFFISCDRSISDRILAPLSAASAEPALTFSAVHFGGVPHCRASASLTVVNIRGD